MEFRSFRTTFLHVALAGLLFAPLSASADAGTVAASWEAQVARISAGDDTAARADAIGERLDAMGLAWRAEPFEQDDRKGQNIVADLGGSADAPLLLIGAHYDRVEVGHGATDNASGVAAVLELAERLKATPLPHHRVQLVFWDLEELGLLGSRAWVATPGREQPALYVNFDVFGWGDTLWMMTPQDDTALVTALRASTSANKLGFSPGQTYPPTDHLPFQRAGWPAVSFSLVGGDEIPGILQVFSRQKPERMPKVMEVIHSDKDTVGQLDATGIPAAVAALDAALRSWDADAAAAAAPHAH